MKEKTMFMRFCILSAAFLIQCGNDTNPMHYAGTVVETGNTTVRGKTLNDKGQAFPSAQISLFTDGYLHGEVKQREFRKDTIGDESGIFVFDSLPMGKFHVVGHDEDGRQSFSKRFHILTQAGFLSLGNSYLSSSSEIKGVVSVYDDRIPDGVEVFIRGTDLHTTAGPLGDFHFRNVPGGVHILQANARAIGIECPQLLTLVVPSAETVECNLTIPEPEKFRLEIVPGQTWYYKQTYVFEGSKSDETPDTITNHSNHMHVCDTLIAGENYHKIESRTYSIRRSATGLGNNRKKLIYVHVGQDTVKVLRKSGLGHTLMKTAGLNGSTAMKRCHRRLKMFNAKTAAYDTSGFVSLTVPLISNMIPDSGWFYVSSNDPFGNWPIKKKFLGHEVVEVPGGTYNCLRIEWDWNWNVPDGFSAGEWDIKGTDMLAHFGLAKRFFNYGTIEETDEDGNVVGEFRTTEVFEYMGKDSISIDSIWPAVPQSLLDSVIQAVERNWGPARYAEWACTLAQSDTCNPRVGNMSMNMLWGLVECVWGRQVNDSLWGNGCSYSDSCGPSICYTPILDYIGRTPFPARLEDYADREEFVAAVLLRNHARELNQGWSDCDWDWKTQGLWHPDSSELAFGESKISEQLKEALEGYYLYLD